MGTVHRLPHPTWRGERAFHDNGQIAWDGTIAYHPDGQPAWIDEHGFYAGGQIAYCGQRVWSSDERPDDPPLWSRAQQLAEIDAYDGDYEPDRLWVVLDANLHLLVTVHGIALYVYRRRVHTRHFESRRCTLHG